MAKTKTESASGEGKSKKKMKLWKKILIGIGVFILLVIMLSFSATSGIVKMAEKQLNLVASGDLKGAYALTSQEFQRSVSYDQFLAYVNNYEVLKNYKNHKFTSREIQGGTGTIQGTLTAKDETTTPVEYKFIKENSEWKILSIDLSGKAGTNASSGSNSPADNGSVKTFSDSNLGYSIQYPKDWTAEKKDSVTALFSGPKEKKMDDVTINIQNLLSVNRGGKYANIDDVVNDLMSQVKNMDKHATFSKIADITFPRADGTDLPSKTFSMIFTNQGKKFGIMQIIVPHGDDLTFHSMGYTAPFDKFEKNLDLVKPILETWIISK
jgi:hypothetical protein